MDFGGINEPQKIKKIKKKTWPTAKNSTRFKSPNQIPFSLRRDLNSPVSIPSSIPFRSTRPRWQFGNKHARILARGSGSRRPNLRLKWKIVDGKIGRRHPSKQISFVPGKNSLSLANDSWSMRRRDSLRAQTNRFCAPPRGSISLFSFPRVEVGKESSSHGSLVENGRLDQSRLRLTSVWEKEGRDTWTRKLRSA